MAGQPGDSGLERQAARPAQEAEGECELSVTNSGNLPDPPLLTVNWASFRKGTVFLLRLFSDWCYPLEPN